MTCSPQNMGAADLGDGGGGQIRGAGRSQRCIAQVLVASRANPTFVGGLLTHKLDGLHNQRVRPEILLALYIVLVTAGLRSFRLCCQHR